MLCLNHSICLHRGEEPGLGGHRGICNVFFTRCNLRCVYCQNHQISRNPEPGLEHLLTLGETADRVERILDQGAGALGLVSPSHVAPQARNLVRELRRRGRRPVVVYNTNTYDRVETLQSLASEVDVYLPDLKYLDASLAARLSDAPQYPEAAVRACAALDAPAAG